MLSRLIDFSIANRLLVIAMTLLVAMGGAYAAIHLPIDAIPDMTNVQVQILTDAGSLSPIEVEKYVSYPIETAMAGLPRVEQIRSVSKFGLSAVTIVFEEGTDIQWARQLVSQRLGDGGHQDSPRASARRNWGRWPRLSAKFCNSKCAAADATRWICGRCSNGRLRPSSREVQRRHRDQRARRVLQVVRDSSQSRPAHELRPFT